MAESLKGWVTSFKHETTRTGKDVWRVGLGGKEWSAFDPTIVQGLKEGLYITADVSETQKGRYLNRYFNGYEVTSPPPGEKFSPPETSALADAMKPPVPPEVWESKDRAVYMESAYKTAATYMTAAAKEHVSTHNLRLLARAIYKDIMAARAGESFEG